MKATPVTLLLAAVLSSGCGPKVDVTPLTTLTDARTEGEIEIFASREAIERPYRKIAIINVDDEGWGRDESELVERMAEEAKKVGADALLLVGTSTEDSGGILVGNVFVDSDHRISRGIALKYHEE